MQEAAALQEDNPARIERFIESDLAFHDVLVEAAGNPLLPILLEPVTRHLLDFRRLTFSVPGGVQRSMDYHRRILDEVEAHDATACRRAMAEHLQDARNALEQVKAQGLG
jgi:DNA-binding FadR family transcriptional regulator